MKMTVLYLGKQGGACIYTYEMIKELLNKRILLQVILSNEIENKDKFEKLNEKKQLQIIYINTYNSNIEFVIKSLNIFKFLCLSKKINKFSPDWIYLPMITLWARMVIPFISKKIKIVTTIHDFSMHLGERNNIIEHINYYIIKKSNKIVTLSQKFIPLIMKRFKFNENEICWIKHGNHNYYRPQNYHFKNNLTKKILFFGRIYEYKGVSILLDAMLKINKIDKDIHLNIVGDGILSDTDLTKIYKLGTSITLANRWITDDEMYTFFEDIDIVVVPYIEASQSGIIMLAYTFGKPVIATNVGGLSEQVYPDTGLIIPSNDCDALVDSIINLYKTPKKILALGNAARKKSDTELSWADSAQTLLNFLGK